MSKNLAILFCLCICIFSNLVYANDQISTPSLNFSQNASDEFLINTCKVDIKKSSKNIESFQSSICHSYMEGAADGYRYGLKKTFLALKENHQKFFIDKLINDDGLCQAGTDIQSSRDVAITLFNRDENDPANNPWNLQKRLLKFSVNGDIKGKNCISSLKRILVMSGEFAELRKSFYSSLKRDCGEAITKQDIFDTSSCNMYIKGFFEMEQLATMSAISKFDNQAQLEIISDLSGVEKKNCFPERSKNDAHYRWAKLYLESGTQVTASQNFPSLVTNVHACNPNLIEKF